MQHGIMQGTPVLGKTLKLAFITVVLCLGVAVTLLVRSSTANPYEAYTYTAPPTIAIESPMDNGAYSSKDAQLSFIATKPEHGWLISWTRSSDPEKVFKNKLSHVSILIDGKLYRSIEADSDLSSPFSYHENLTNLDDGSHNLTIIAYCDGWDLEAHGFWERYLPYNVTSDLITFTVDTTPPFVSILSPENVSYVATENLVDVALNFTLKEPVSQLSYSLDGQADVTVLGNTTLAGLAYGAHNLTVYAVDVAGNIGASETVYFTIAELEPEPEPFPAAPVAAASAATVAVVGVGLLVYFRKRKH
jgi:hypothetical protein